MLKIKKSIKFNLNGWLDPKLANIYKLVPDRNNLTLWINGKNRGTFTATLINYLDYKWKDAVCSTKEFKRGLKDCIENGF